jgi:CheY-like chemotaxis protein
MRVLLVDDDDLIRATLVEILSGVGYEVLESGDPNQALGLPQAVGPPDVLVTDIDLGAELTRPIHRIDAGVAV